MWTGRCGELFHSFTGRLDYCAGDVELQLEALAYLEAQALHVHPFEDFNSRAVRVMVAERCGGWIFPFSSSASNGTPPHMPGMWRRCGSGISTGRWLCCVNSGGTFVSHRSAIRTEGPACDAASSRG